MFPIYPVGYSEKSDGMPSYKKEELPDYASADPGISAPAFADEGNITDLEFTSQAYIPPFQELAYAFSQASKEELCPYYCAVDQYEKDGLETDWLSVGYGVLLYANAPGTYLELFAKSAYRLEKRGLTIENFTWECLELSKKGIPAYKLDTWFDNFIYLEEKGLPTKDYTKYYGELCAADASPTIRNLFSEAAVLRIERGLQIDALYDECIGIVKADNYKTQLWPYVDYINADNKIIKASHKPLTDEEIASATADDYHFGEEESIGTKNNSGNTLLKTIFHPIAIAAKVIGGAIALLLH